MCVGTPFGGACISPVERYNQRLVLSLRDGAVAIDPPTSEPKKGPGLICAKHPPGRSGKLNLGPFSAHPPIRSLPVMAIRVTCPNGHLLKVKDKHAGKSGYCPHCHARVQVPTQEPISDDEILGIMGPPPAAEPDKYPSDDDEYVHQEPRHVGAHEYSSIKLLGPSFARRQKLCSNCCNLVSFSFSLCPRCGTPLSVAPVAQPK